MVRIRRHLREVRDQMGLRRPFVLALVLVLSCGSSLGTGLSQGRVCSRNYRYFAHSDYRPLPLAGLGGSSKRLTIHHLPIGQNTHVT
jgi:hypothetical protein